MPIFVIAGDYHEYFAFLKREGLQRTTPKYIFISDPTRLYGIRDCTVLCVGRYWLSPVYLGKDYLNYRGITWKYDGGMKSNNRLV